MFESTAVNTPGSSATVPGLAPSHAAELAELLARLGLEVHPAEPCAPGQEPSSALSAPPEVHALLAELNASGEDGGYAADQRRRRQDLSRHAAWFVAAVADAGDELDVQVEELLTELRARSAATDIDAVVADLESDDILPGPWLAGLLAGTGLEDLDDYGLVDVAAGWQRMISWASAGLARAAAALARSTSMNPSWPGSAGEVRVRTVVGEELAMRLGCSRTAAQKIVRTGTELAGPLAETGRQLATGRLDPARVEAMVRALADLPVQTVLEVEHAVLRDAPNRTPTQLAEDVQRALIAVDPQEAERRCATATQKRRVDRPKRMPDGMAGIWALLPAPTAVRIDTDLDARARTLRAGGDERTLDQLRADLFSATLLHDELRDRLEPCSDDHAEPPSPPLQVLCERPRRASNRLRSERLRAQGPRSTPDRTGPTGRTGRTGRTMTPSPLGPVTRPRRAAPPRSLRPAGPFATSDPLTSEPPETTEAWASEPVALPDPPDLPGLPDPPDLPDPPGRRRLRARTSRTVINVTVPITTLLGLDDEPAQLAGYGPISATTARRLAAHGTWRRLLTDPASGAVLDVGRTRYRPPADLAAHVRERDQVCARPGCSSPATSCELDHTIEFARADGTTAHTNLGPLCRRDHQIKTDGGFTVVQPVPGVFVWRTPTGQVYVVRPGAGGRWQRMPRSALRGLTGPATSADAVRVAVARLVATGRTSHDSVFDGPAPRVPDAPPF
ncbi:MAG: DUF222 domain-containing protein [Cellulomonadaceae bacterium]